MGKITKDVFGGGFTFRDDDGKKTHYRESFLGGGYVGSDGSRIRESIVPGDYIFRDSSGEKETFHSRPSGFGFWGSDGTSIEPDIFGTGADVRKKKK